MKIKRAMSAVNPLLKPFLSIPAWPFFHNAKSFPHINLLCFFTIYPQGKFNTGPFIINNIQIDFHRIGILFFLYSYTYTGFLREYFSLREEKIS